MNANIHHFLSQPGVDDGAEGPERAQYRSLIMLDWRLGSDGCPAKDLLACLKQHPSQYLFVLGQIVDPRDWVDQGAWPQSHIDVVQKMLKKARKGCRVQLLPAASDHHLTPLIGGRFGRVDIARQAEHITATGQRLLLRSPTAAGLLKERWARWLSEPESALSGSIRSQLSPCTAVLESLDGQLTPLNWTSAIESHHGSLNDRSPERHHALS
jgi:hypothetical protein